MAPDYSYEVFISYRQDSSAASFAKNQFLKAFRSALWDALAAESLPPVFLDVAEIHVGDQWPVRLQNGIKESRVMIALLTPSYFRSEWCMSEFASFEAREKQKGVQLIVPVCYSNSTYVLQQVGNIRQVFDLSRIYENVGQTTRPEDLALLVNQLIMGVANEVKRKIDTAPPFDVFPLCQALAKPKPQVPLLGFGNAA